MKQAIAARGDLGIGPGKLAAQVAHASLLAYEQTDPDGRAEWKRGGQKKVVLRVEDERQLHELREAAVAAGLPAALVRDAGRTELEPGTPTAVAIGPAADRRIDAITGDLPLY